MFCGAQLFIVGFMSFCVSLYMLSLLLMCFVPNVVTYCVLLILNSVLSVSIMLISSGFSWYPLIFYLVYVGGVYVLLIFITVHLPNLNLNNFTPVVMLSISFFFFLSFFFLNVEELFNDYSFNFCSLSEGYSYIFISCFLVIGFSLISLISSSKEGFIR